jgi:hypothetical protein
LRQGADHQRFGQPGHAFQQAVAAGQEGHQHFFHGDALPHDHFGNFGLQPGQFGEQFFDGMFSKGYGWHERDLNPKLTQFKWESPSQWAKCSITGMNGGLGNGQ